MRQYLGFKRVKDASGAVVQVVGRIRHKKHARANIDHEQHFSVKQSHLIIGADNAGKSRWIGKLKRESAHLWKRDNVLAIRSIDALSEWYTGLPYQFRRGLTEPPKTTGEKMEVMRQWLGGGVLIVDDIHRATGRKVDYIHELMSSSKIIIVSSTSHHKIHPKLRTQIENRKPVVHDLYSRTTYDATQWAVWLMVCVMLLAGAPEGAVLLGGASLLRSGAKSRGQV